MTTFDHLETGEDQDEITRLVTSAREEGEGDDHAGHRTALRFAAGMQLDVTPDPGDSSRSWPVTMHNVSDSGFAFWSRRQLLKSDPIWVREFSADNSAPWIRAQVTHCTVGIRGYLVGAHFDTDAAVNP